MWGHDVVLLRRLFVYGLYFSFASLSHKVAWQTPEKKKGEQISAFIWFAAMRMQRKSEWQAGTKNFAFPVLNVALVSCVQ